MIKFRHLITSFVFVFALIIPAFATTWFPKDFICPIDGQKNTFQVVGSYGSYIYSWPSKYQWLFWPATESPTYYICKKCHLTTYMWDYEELPKDKIPDLKKVLADIKVSKEFADYQEIPVTERLEIMEKVYKILDKDDEWWETFYRTEGYHYGKAGDTEKAMAARKKSLGIIEKMLTDERSESPKKLALYISASMKHFMNDDKGAIADLESALMTKYQEKGLNETESKDAEEGLNERIKDYIEKIKSEKEKPRLFDKYSSEN